jgi:hypothetical protein
MGYAQPIPKVYAINIGLILSSQRSIHQYEIAIDKLMAIAEKFPERSKFCEKEIEYDRKRIKEYKADRNEFIRLLMRGILSFP